MLQVFYTVESTLSAVVTNKDFDNNEAALSYAVDLLTRPSPSTINIITKVRFQENTTTTFCTRTISTTAITLANLRTCP
jgi:hypothetical protein